MSENSADLIIVGAGLAGLMTAWRCLDLHPELSILVIETSDKIAGDHTWSFNRSDIIEPLQDWIKPFIAYQWDKYDVKFPMRERQLDIPYCTGNSETLRRCVQPHIESGRLSLMLKTQARGLTASTVTLPDGTKLKAKCVLDARGFKANDKKVLGYQKFVGRTIKTKEPHGLIHPIIMDATVEQLGGYRFVYCLPFTDTEILVEDTYYTDGFELSENEVAARVDDYINTKGWGEHELLRQEKGVLPITLAVDASYGENVTEGENKPVQLGMTGGYYHAVTGYSLPEAVKSAAIVSDMIAKHRPDYAEAILHEMIYHKRDHYREERFMRLLNRMLFRASKPENRYQVLERFYGLNEGLIARFYRNCLSKKDKLRILIGKPPIPVSKALYNFSEKAFMRRERNKQIERNP